MLAALAVSGCTLTDTLPKNSQQNFSSSWVRADDPNAEIGKREHPLVLAKYGGEYRDRHAEGLIAQVVGRLVAVSQDKNQLFRITILNSPKVNAFALPGGYLYVTRGLLALANDSSELAGVIAHEMAHVAANHGILRNEKQRSVEVGTEVVSEVLGNSVAGQVAKAANQIRLAEFSKEQELQADEAGIRMLAEAGYDPHGAARFLQTMQAYQALMSQADSRFGDISFLSSHPATPERIEKARRQARGYGAPGMGESGRDAYLAGIDGLVFGDSVEEGFVRDNRFAHAGLGITFSAPDGHRMENQATAVIVTGPDNMATRFDAAVLPRGRTLEAYLKSGWIKGLDETSISSLTVNGLPAARAEASGGEWHFVIRVLQLDRQVYRFITAGPAASTRIEAESAAIAGTFRRLGEAEKSALAPLRIRVVAVGPQDTLASLSAKMKGVQSPLRNFQIFNGLTTGEIPPAGTKVKIVSE
ncbi:MAG: M48 family metalloprotease [Nitratireductor sp.]|nr:M48 family metalloprotease [Nitratireductor sp.]